MSKKSENPPVALKLDGLGLTKRGQAALAAACAATGETEVDVINRALRLYASSVTGDDVYMKGGDPGERGQ